MENIQKFGNSEYLIENNMKNNYLNKNHIKSILSFLRYLFMLFIACFSLFLLVLIIDYIYRDITLLMRI